MDRAIQLSAESEGGPFGAVVVDDRTGKVIAEAANCVVPTCDPTAHAEVVAIRAACSAKGSHVLAGCTLYSSCEPCPMCLCAAHWARLDRVVFANTRHDAADIGFDDALLYASLSGSRESTRPVLHHRPSQAALDVFWAWHARQDRVHY
jgi:tRNA(Arg) A34 adenosine deaminase TadA